MPATVVLAGTPNHPQALYIYQGKSGTGTRPGTHHLGPGLARRLTLGHTPPPHHRSKLELSLSPWPHPLFPSNTTLARDHGQSLRRLRIRHPCSSLGFRCQICLARRWFASTSSLFFPISPFWSPYRCNAVVFRWFHALFANLFHGQFHSSPRR